MQLGYQEIVHAHLARCLTINLTFTLDSDIESFLPLQGDSVSVLMWSTDTYSPVTRVPRWFRSPLLR